MSDVHLADASLAEHLHQIEEQRSIADARNDAKRKFMRYIFHELRVPLNAIVLGLDDMAAVNYDVGDALIDTQVAMSGAASSAASDVDAATAPSSRAVNALLVALSRPISTITSSSASLSDTTQLLIGNATAMSKLLDDFLSLEKIEEGKFEIEPVQFRVRDMIADASHMFAAPLHAKNLDFTVDVSSAIPDTIKGDVHKLRQVLCNYISNAIKFSPVGGSIFLRVANVLEAEAGAACDTAGKQRTGHGDVYRRINEHGVLLDHAPEVQGLDTTRKHALSAVHGPATSASHQAAMPQPVTVRTRSAMLSRAAEVLTSLASSARLIVARGTRALGRRVSRSPSASASSARVTPLPLPLPASASSPPSIIIEASASAPSSPSVFPMSALALTLHRPPPPQPSIGAHAHKQVCAGASCDGHSHATSDSAADEDAGLKRADYAAYTQCIRFSVTDQGVGISQEDQAKLFQPFNQIKAGALQKGNGTGLGLSICKRIVELSGGRVGVHSKEGRGSTFCFLVPVDGPPAAQLPGTIQVKQPEHAPVPPTGGDPLAVALHDGQAATAPTASRRFLLGAAGKQRSSTAGGARPDTLALPSTGAGGIACDVHATLSGVPHAATTVGVTMDGHPSPSVFPSQPSQPSPGVTPAAASSPPLQGVASVAVPASSASPRHGGAPGPVLLTADDPLVSSVLYHLESLKSMHDGSTSTTTSNVSAFGGSALYGAHGSGRVQHHPDHDSGQGAAPRGVGSGLSGSGSGTIASGEGPGRRAASIGVMKSPEAVGGDAISAVSSPQLDAALPIAAIADCGAVGRLAPSSTAAGTQLEPATASSPPVKDTFASVESPDECDQSPLEPLVTAVVVDDVRTNRDFFGRMLARRGVTTIHYAEDGLQAVALLDGLTPSQVASIQCWFLDKEMPNCDGHGAARQLRARGVTVPIFGVTGNALAEDRREFIAAGATAVITKPVRAPDLEDALARAGLRLPKEQRQQQQR